MISLCSVILFFFFNDTATTEIYTLSLHDALPIYWRARPVRRLLDQDRTSRAWREVPDRKSTRLNSSHSSISYAVFCLKKKKRHKILPHDHKVKNISLCAHVVHHLTIVSLHLHTDQ